MQVVVLAGQCVEVNHHILLHCYVVHHVDEVQQGLHMQTHTKSFLCFFGSHLFIYFCSVVVNYKAQGQKQAALKTYVHTKYVGIAWHSHVNM